MVAHMLVRPGIIDGMRNLVCAQALEPTKQGICDAMDVLTKRYGLVLSRLPPSQRNWRTVDVFALASTQTLGYHYCGSHKLHEQLENWSRLEATATGITQLSGTPEVTFSSLVCAVDKTKLPGYTQKGYWTVHLARVFDPDFCGVTLLNKMVFNQECCKTIMNMGGGAQSMSDLSIRVAHAEKDMKELGSIIVKLNKKYGNSTDLNPGHLACAVCESHRRQDDAGGISHRKGL